MDADDAIELQNCVSTALATRVVVSGALTDLRNGLLEICRIHIKYNQEENKPKFVFNCHII